MTNDLRSKLQFASYGLLLALGACGNRDAGFSVNAQLLLVSGGGGYTAQALSSTDTLNAGEIQTDGITIESLKLPIRDVSLGTGDTLSGGQGSAQPIYSCLGSTGEECMIELVGDELENLFSSSMGSTEHTVAAGSYTFLTIATCWEEGNYTATMKASVQYDGQTYYTKSDGTLTTTAPSEDVSFTLNGCRNYSILSKPVEITGVATVSLFADLRNLVSIGMTDDNGELGGNMSYCKHTTPNTLVSCMTYPDVAGAVGVEDPTIKRYVIIDPSQPTLASVLALYLDPESGEPFGGYIRAFSENGFVGGFTSTGSLKRASLTEAGGYFWTSYTGSSAETIAGNGDYTFDDFDAAGATADENSCSKTAGTFTTTIESETDSAHAIKSCRLD